MKVLNEDSGPEFIKGGQHIDERGVLNYFNDFDLKSIRRMYTIAHPDTSVVRAWQGHRIESKWFMVLEGAFDMKIVKPDHWTNPSEDLPYTEFSLTTDQTILHVPGGYTTGFRATEANSRLMVYSDFSTEESIKDDYRFNKDLWYKW